jgi:hypothetical protein
MQLDTGRVLGEDPTLDRPDATGVGMRDQGFEEGAADALTAQASVHVHAVFQDPRVCAAIRDLRRRNPADHLAMAGGNESILGRMRRRPALERRDLRLERGVTGGDPIGVNGADRRPVLVAERADHEVGRHGVGSRVHGVHSTH